MKKNKMFISALIMSILISSTNVVNAASGLGSYKMVPNEFEITDHKVWKSKYTNDLETGPSSSLPIMTYENYYHNGLIYDFGQFGDEPNGTRDFLNGEEKYDLENESESRETLTTSKYNFVDYNFSEDDDLMTMKTTMMDKLDAFVLDPTLDNFYSFYDEYLLWREGTENYVNRDNVEKIYMSIPLFYNTAELNSYYPNTDKLINRTNDPLVLSNEAEIEYFQSVSDEIKEKLDEVPFGGQYEEYMKEDFISNIDGYLDSKVYYDMNYEELSKNQEEQIENLLRLGYSEINSEVSHKGTAVDMMSNIDGFLATQWNLYNILKEDFNLNYEGTDWDHEGENIRVTQIREYWKDNIGRNSFFLEESIINLGNFIDDDLNAKFNKQSTGLTETNLAEEGENYVKEYKFTIPIDQEDFDEHTPEEWKSLEHRVGVENIKLSLDTDIKDAKILITRENEEYSYDLGTNPVEIKQGDNIKVIIPKASVKELNKDVELKLTYEEPEFDFEIVNAKFNQENLDKIEKFKNEYEKDYNNIIKRNDEGFKYLIVKDKKMVDKSFDDLYKFKYEKEEPEGNGNSGSSSSNKNKNKEENKRPKIEQENLELHKAYIKGYEDGTFRPQENITRAEVATIFSRIMTNQEDINYSNSQKYTDVKSSDWYAKYIAFVSDNKIMKGYPEGDFEPNDSITRAELTAVVSRYKSLNQGENKFEDAKKHWAEEYIGYASTAGYIVGYPDGTFKPDKNVSREEAVTMINRMLGRKVDDEGINNQNISKFKDLDKNSWSYYDIVEASNSHKYDKEDKSKEIWEEIVK